jgi:uncharacterized protein (DUF433 family)
MRNSLFTEVPKQDRRFQAVLSLLAGGKASEVAARFGIARSDLFKFKRRALDAMRAAMADKRRGPKRPANQLPEDREIIDVRWKPLYRPCLKLCVRGKIDLMEPRVTQDEPGENEPASSPLLDRPRIVSTPGTCGGKPCLDGHRITVKQIVLDYQREGMSPDEIVSAYPTLTLSDVHAALAYYYGHQAEIDTDIKEDDDHWAEVQRQNPGRLIDRLRQRKANAPDHTIPPG